MDAREDFPEAVVGDWEEMLEPYRNDQDSQSPVAVYPDRIRARAQAGYYGHMTHIHHQLNRLLKVIKESGVFDNTWICFVSDHGELMGDHHCYRKSLPYEGSARVPLIITPPRNRDLPAGQRSDALVELRDIMPTLLDCAGLEIPAGLDGRSLVPAVSGEPGAGHPVIHGEHLHLGQSIQRVTDGEEKYIWWSGDGREQLFDLDDDPDELHDLALDDDTEESLAYWRKLLVKELCGREDGFSNGISRGSRRSQR